MPPNNQRNIRDKQVRLHTYDNEPTARMAEQRLRSVGVPAMVRSLNVGPGLWGTAYNMPHGLYVFETDESKAREVLGLDSADSQDNDEASPKRGSLWLILVVVGLVLALAITAPAWASIFG